MWWLGMLFGNRAREKNSVTRNKQTIEITSQTHCWLAVGFNIK